MKKLKVRLLQLGYPPIRLSELTSWSSKFFEFESTVYHKTNLPNSDGHGWSYSKKILSKIVGNGSGADITIGITDKPIEHNYYMHRLSNKTCVLSLYEVAQILSTENIPTETFLIRNVYEIVSFFIELKGKIASNAYVVPHEDTRGCLFDFNPIKTDILASTRRVGLCDDCKARLSSKDMPMGFVNDLLGELKRIKKPLIFKIIDFVKEHPIWAFLMSLIVGISVNVFSNFVYDLLTRKR